MHNISLCLVPTSLESISQSTGADTTTQSTTVQMLWSGAILALSAIYVWATVMFGARFSNLTHRGILTNGPYRWTKHPAYVSKNLSWWLISAPFVVMGSPWEALRASLALLALNALYYLRARTEEQHLGRDPDYQRYAEWMNRYGLFSFLSRTYKK